MIKKYNHNISINSRVYNKKKFLKIKNYVILTIIKILN